MPPRERGCGALRPGRLRPPDTGTRGARRPGAPDQPLLCLWWLAGGHMSMPVGAAHLPVRPVGADHLPVRPVGADHLPVRPVGWQRCRPPAMDSERRGGRGDAPPWTATAGCPGRAGFGAWLSLLRRPPWRSLCDLATQHDNEGRRACPSTPLRAGSDMRALQNGAGGKWLSPSGRWLGLWPPWRSAQPT